MTSIDSKGRVFLTDGIIRRTVAAVRTLEKRGVSTTTGAETKLNITFFSKYCKSKFVYPSPRETPQQFVDALVAYLEANPHDVLIPMEQDTLDIVLENRERFEALTSLPFASNEAYQVFRDKAKTMALAEKIGVSIPKTVVLTDIEALETETAALKFPVIIKARSNWASRGMRTVEHRRDLRKIFMGVHAESPFPLIQEKIPAGGAQYHVCSIFNQDSEPIATCTQYEVRHYPHQEGKGISTAQLSTSMPELEAITIKMMRANNWYGVANADFIIDPRDGTPMLLEINPRFWGPLQASINSGVDFPYLLYRIGRGEAVAPQKGFKTGVLTRSFIPYDILHFITNPKRRQMKPKFFKLFGADVNYDLLSAEDPLPFIGFLFTLARFMFDPETWTRLAHMEKMGKLLSKLRRKPLTSPTNTLQSKTQSVK